MTASNFIPKDVKVVIQSENGILGMVRVMCGKRGGWGGLLWSEVDIVSPRVHTLFLEKKTQTLSMQARRLSLLWREDRS